MVATATRRRLRVVRRHIAPAAAAPRPPRDAAIDGELSGSYSVSSAQVDAYHRDGHIHLPGVLSTAECAALRAAVRSAVAETDMEAAMAVPMAQREPKEFSRIFAQTFNLREQSRGVAHFAHSRRLAELAANLMRVDSIRIYYDKAMFKEPLSEITPLHQDGPHWPLATDTVLTMWIALVDMPSDMGTLHFASGTHNQRAFGERGIDVERTERFYRYTI